MTVNTLTKRLLRPNIEADKNLRKKIDTLNLEIANYNAKREENEIIRREGIKLAKMVLEKPEPVQKSFGKGNRFAAFTSDERKVIFSALSVAKEMHDHMAEVVAKKCSREDCSFCKQVN